MASELLSLELPCDRHAPMLVRDALAKIHDGEWSLEDGRLVATELVANAVRHSGGAGEDRLRIDIGIRDDCLVISVHDPGLSGQAADRADGDPTEPGGWGLRIVEQLADAWGCERPDGYRVWAAVRCSPAPAPAR